MVGVCVGVLVWVVGVCVGVGVGVGIGVGGGSVVCMHCVLKMYNNESVYERFLNNRCIVV